MPRSLPRTLAVLTGAVTVGAAAAVAHRLLVRSRALIPPDPQPEPARVHLTHGPVGTGASMPLTDLIGLLADPGRCGRPTASGTPCQRRTTTPPCASHPA